MKYKKVLILGSGALKIGQAGEFDYSGSQAIKALKEEGVRTVLINPNIATIQTSKGLADQVYFLPVTPYFVTKVIEKEKPDGILLSFGGQTALNCGLELKNSLVFERNNISVLGTPVDSISLTEDRQLFAQHLRSINIPTPSSQSANSVEEAQLIAKELGYPLMVRAAYALGGEKSGLVQSNRELNSRVQEALAISPQVLIEKYLHHFKEIEYEVVRDKDDNCLTICNMENMDPLGIHTGESIVVAPSQTLTSLEFHHLRSMAIKIVRSLGIIGECNVQYALNPASPEGTVDYYVIEVNARLSRSSALASKATGYPLAYVAAKLALGYTLPEVRNQITKVTTAFFEPALDYVVVKLPRWDLEKFDRVHHHLGSSMKSVGEVMAIDRTFEAALQKAVRMLDLGLTGITDKNAIGQNKDIDEHLKKPTHKRLFALITALKTGYSLEKLHDMTGIDMWFLYCLQNIVVVEKTLQKSAKIDRYLLREAKTVGFSDEAIAHIRKSDEKTIRSLRRKFKVTPSVFAIDTLAGEFPAKTNYLYMTYSGNHHDVIPLKKSGTIVLGSGPYRIGSSVEFDWTCVRTAESLKTHQQSPIVINCNPETVSTDYDVSDRLYFEELSLERVLDIYDFEKSKGIIVSVGGQTPNNLSQELNQYGISILGTKTENIDRAENRSTFSALLDKLNISQPKWQTFTKENDAIKFAQEVEYPVLVRPSYVLSGSAMRVCYRESDLKAVLIEASKVGSKQAVTVSKFIEGAREIEYDGVAQKGKLIAGFISEHLEHAGVHSGDATIIYPPEKLYLRTQRIILKAVLSIIKELAVTGPFNIQFIAKQQEVLVIEMNLRASRTFPLLSKASGVDLAELLTDALFSKAKPIQVSDPNYTVVKVPQFSFSRLEGADPILRVEMASTGEVATFGDSLEEAYLKSQLSIGAIWPKRGVFLSLGGIDNKVRFLESAWLLKRLNLPIFATEKTAQFLKNNGFKVTMLHKIHEGLSPNVLDCFKDKLVDLAINIVDPHFKKEISDDYTIRRSAVDQNIFLITNRHQAELFIKSISEKNLEDLQIKSWSEYQKD